MIKRKMCRWSGNGDISIRIVSSPANDQIVPDRVVFFGGGRVPNAVPEIAKRQRPHRASAFVLVLEFCVFGTFSEFFTGGNVYVSMSHRQRMGATKILKNIQGVVTYMFHKKPSNSQSF